MSESDGIFDFTRKLALYPERVAAALEDAPGPSLSTVFMDLASESCNHDCIFCDGNMYEFEHARFTTERLLELADEMAELGVDSLIFAGEKSEPTVHPGFPAFAHRLLAHGITLGIYTNGSRPTPAVLEPLASFEFVRVSMDAGSAATHRLIHNYSDRRDDFATLLEFLSRVSAAPGVAVGTSFVLLRENAHELALAASLAKEHGADFIEPKPVYGERYSFDGGALREFAPILNEQLRMARELEDESFRVVLNNQIRAFLSDEVGADELTTVAAPRPCLTNRLRLVVSPRGCYLCTPHRGRMDKSIGNVSTKSLREVWYSARHHHLMQEPCSLRCTYHEQNDLLLRLRAGDARLETEAASGAPELQRAFL